MAKAVRRPQVAAYPLLIHSTGSGCDTIVAKILSGTGSYFRLTVPAGAAAKNVKILDPSGATNATFAGEHVYVLRVQ